MPAKHDPDDYWGQAVTLLTGYAVPSRKTLFDTLSSKEHIPLFRGGLENLNVPILSEKYFTALVGWHAQEGEDYNLAFVDAGGDGKHDTASLRQATIVFIGVPVDGNGRARLLDAGELTGGGKFTGSQGDEWDFGPLGQYSSGPKAALQKLLADGTTRGFSYNGYDVLNAEAVDANSFERTAQSFDRTMKFFKDHATTLTAWETSLGEENAAWRGQAAGLFWQLIHQLRTNYDDYVDQLGGATFTATQTFKGGHTPQSKLSNALAAAQKVMLTEAQNLNNAWDKWASDGRHDPHRILMELLDELTAWVLQNNIKHTKVHTYSAMGASGFYYSTDDGFLQTHPTYGNLRDYNTTWKKVGEAAVAAWNKHVQDVLVAAASLAITNLKTAWSELEDAFEELETKNTSTLTDQYDKDQKDILNDQANKNQENLNNSLNNLGDNLNNLGDGLGDSLNDLGNNLGDGLNGLGDNLGDSLNGLGDGLGDSLNGLGDGLTNLGNGLGDGLDLGLGDGLGDGLGNNLSSNLGTDLGLGDGLGTGTDLGTGLGTDLGTGLGTGLGLGLGLGGTDDGNDATKGSTVTNPDGSTTTLNPDGTLTTRYPDGTTQLLDPETGTITTTAPDGTVTTGDLTVPGGYTNPDGSVTSLNPDGTLTTTFPDGTVTTINPETGELTTTNPDGSVETGNIGGLGDGLGDIDLTSPTIIPPTTSSSSLGDLGNLSSLGNLSDLGDGLGSSSNNLVGSSLGDGTSGLTSSGLVGSGIDSGNFADYDNGEDSTGDLLSGGALGAPLSAAADGSADSSGGSASGGSPLFPGMGGMGGMGGGGAGGGGNGPSERVRNVLTEPGGGNGRRGGRPNGRKSSAAAEDEDVAVVRGGRTSTSSGAAVVVGAGAAGQGNRSTESGDRDRQSWMAEPEDEDVWGTDEGGAPAVIGK